LAGRLNYQEFANILGRNQAHQAAVLQHGYSMAATALDSGESVLEQVIGVGNGKVPAHQLPNGSAVAGLQGGEQIASRQYTHHRTPLDDRKIML
jgi:hypothetical protein